MQLSQLSCPLSQDRQCRKRTKSFGKGILDEEPPAPLKKPLQLYCSDFYLRFFHNASTQESAAYSPSKAWKEGDTSKFLLLAGLGGSLIIVWGLFLFSCLKKAFSDLFPCESFIVHFIIQYGCHQTEQAAGQGKSWLAKVDCFYFCNNSPSRHSPILVGSTHIVMVGAYKDRNTRIAATFGTVCRAACSGTMKVILGLRRLKKKDHEFEAILGYIESVFSFSLQLHRETPMSKSKPKQSQSQQHK